MPFQKTVKRSDLPPGQKKIVEINGLEIALFHLERGIFAVSNICPHSGGALGEGFVSGSEITCPLHFWQFNLETGRSSRPRDFRIETYPVKIEKEWIWLDLPEEDSGT